MDSSYIIAALALFTIGATLIAAIAHFGYYLKDPENLEAAKRVAEDRESATTRMSAEGAQRRTLRQRLDAAPGINDSLGPRRGGLNPWDAMVDTKWSDVRRSLNTPSS